MVWNISWILCAHESPFNVIISILYSGLRGSLSVFFFESHTSNEDDNESNIKNSTVRLKEESSAWIKCLREREKERSKDKEKFILQNGINEKRWKCMLIIKNRNRMTCERMSQVRYMFERETTCERHNLHLFLTLKPSNFICQRVYVRFLPPPFFANPFKSVEHQEKNYKRNKFSARIDEMSVKKNKKNNGE